MDPDAAYQQLLADAQRWISQNVVGEQIATDSVGVVVGAARRRGIPVIRGYVDAEEECIILEIARPRGFG